MESTGLRQATQWISTVHVQEATSLSIGTGYAFNNGEQIIFSPTTIDQVYRFITTLAVSGFTTEGSYPLLIGVLDWNLQLKYLGSAGADQILGGLGNQYKFLF